jgi:transposase
MLFCSHHLHTRAIFGADIFRNVTEYAHIIAVCVVLFLMRFAALLTLISRGVAHSYFAMSIILSDEEWGRVDPLMPTRRRGARASDRKVISAIVYVLTANIPWRDLPAYLGPYTTAYNRYKRWSRRGLWQRIATELGIPARAVESCASSKLRKAIRRGSSATKSYASYVQHLTI